MTPELPRARLRDLAVSAAIGRTVDPDVVAIMAESLLDALDNMPDDLGTDDAVHLPTFVEDLKKERDAAIDEENDTIRDLKADVERLETENDKLGDAVADLEKQLAAAFSGEKIETLKRERDKALADRDEAIAAVESEHERGLAELAHLRSRVLASISDHTVFCRLPGCYNEAHSSDGRCTFHRGDDEPPAAEAAPKKKRTRSRKGAP